MMVRMFIPGIVALWAPAMCSAATVEINAEPTKLILIQEKTIYWNHFTEDSKEMSS